MRTAVPLVGALLVLTVAGCGPGVPPPPTSAPEPSASPPLSEQLGVTCGEGPAFRPSLLEQTGHAETDPDPAAGALRAEIATGGGTIPPTGWIRVAQTADRVQFVAPSPGGATWWVVGLMVGDGAWVLDLAGECRPQVAAPAGSSLAGWWLDPAFPRPAPEARTINVVLVESACASGSPPVGRVLGPVISSTPTELRIVLFVRQRPGAQDCQGNPEFPMEIELSEPLGARALLDAGVFPPRDASRPPG